MILNDKIYLNIKKGIKHEKYYIFLIFGLLITAKAYHLIKKSDNTSIEDTAKQVPRQNSPDTEQSNEIS